MIKAVASRVPYYDGFTEGGEFREVVMDDIETSAYRTDFIVFRFYLLYLDPKNKCGSHTVNDCHKGEYRHQNLQPYIELFA